MEQYIGSLINRYRNQGVLVDTNLLLLFFVGFYDQRRIQGFGRTSQFEPEDFLILQAFLQRFDRFVTTPHVLAETSNLLRQIPGDSAKRDCHALLKQTIPRMQEHHTAAATVAAEPGFVQLGLTDMAIAKASPGVYLVLTDDLDLYGYLSNRGVDALNFNNIRPFDY